MESGVVVHLAQMGELVQNDVVDESVGQVHEVVGEGDAAVAATRAQASDASPDDYAVVAVARLAGPLFEPLGQEVLGGFFEVAVYFPRDGLLHWGNAVVDARRHHDEHLSGELPAANVRICAVRYFDGESAGGDNVART